MAPIGGGPNYRLVRTAAPDSAPPTLNEAQRAVVEHPGGPLLVLAGPGTGKTTTLVEAVVARVERGFDPERILVLTLGRRAAGGLRERITGRMARACATSSASTFHALCHSLLRQACADGDPPRVLSGAEQEVAVRELLRGSMRGPSPIRWPAELVAAVGTQGFAEEVIEVLTRIVEHDVELRSLVELDPAGRELWAALAQFAECYLDVLDARGMVDHPGLLRRALLWAQSPSGRATLRARYDAVFVDEYQDVSPAQARLLEVLAGDGRDVVVFGDPDQAIHRFRGADVRQLLDFGDRFRTRAGHRAPVQVLGVSYRVGPALLAAGRAVAGRLPLRGPDAASVRAHRAPVPAPRRSGQGAREVEVCTFPSVGAELAHVAAVLRRAHLEEGLPWSEMAVLVRSAERDVPNVRRVLGTAGVPVGVAVDELPLRLQAAVATLLTTLQIVLDPESVRAEAVRTLLLSPWAGLDPDLLRRLGQVLQTEADGSIPEGELIRDALLDPARLAGWVDPDIGRLRGLAEVLSGAALTHRACGGPDEVLWQIWSGTGWPDRLERAAAGSGLSAARANRDLDAVCALFDAAERMAGHGRGGLRRLLDSLAAQRIPEESALPRPRVDTVALLTAHRAKGLEFSLVAVVGVQEGGWPDLRRRGRLLGGDRITAEGLTPPTSSSAALAEERRLFYVAITRARSRLLVTAVDATDSDGERPSRFLGELGVEPQAFHGHPHRPLSVAALVADLRSVLVDTTDPGPMREAAAARLAVLADTRDSAGTALAPAASPDTWWGLAEPTLGPEPIRDPRAPLELSAGAVEGLSRCPLRWFLIGEVAAAQAPGPEAAFGTVVHALAEEVGAGGESDLHRLGTRLDAAWDANSFESGWQCEQHKDSARQALARFLAWHEGRPDRAVLGVEVPFGVEVDAGGTAVRLRGRIDRVERDAAGSIHLVDLKTARTPVPAAAVAEHPQLGAYQFAVRAGALRDLPGADARLAGAELVMLRQPDRAGLPKVLVQPPVGGADEPDRFAEVLAEAARRVRQEVFAPRPSEECDRCEFRRCCSARPEGRGVIR